MPYGIGRLSEGADLTHAVVVMAILCLIAIVVLLRMSSGMR